MSESIHDQHIRLVRAVNEAPDAVSHQQADHYLTGWRDGVRAAGIVLDLLGMDLHYMNAGVNRPMCCGIWLDWTPAAPAKGGQA